MHVFFVYIDTKCRTIDVLMTEINNIIGIESCPTSNRVPTQEDEGHGQQWFIYAAVIRKDIKTTARLDNCSAYM